MVLGIGAGIMARARGGGKMKGKIDNTGWLYKEAPNGKMQTCACCVDRSEFCHWSCVAFDGPLPEKECAWGRGDGTTCHGNCDRCEIRRPTGRTEIHYCKGVLKFDGFVDERVK